MEQPETSDFGGDISILMGAWADCKISTVLEMSSSVSSSFITCIYKVWYFMSFTIIDILKDCLSWLLNTMKSSNKGKKWIDHHHHHHHLRTLSPWKESTSPGACVSAWHQASPSRLNHFSENVGRVPWWINRFIIIITKMILELVTTNQWTDSELSYKITADMSKSEHLWIRNQKTAGFFWAMWNYQRLLMKSLWNPTSEMDVFRATGSTDSTWSPALRRDGATEQSGLTQNGRYGWCFTPVHS